jgi:hypothetical protein
MTPSTGAARDAVRELLDVVGWLAAALLPGTTKPYRAPQMSADKRAEADARAKLEKLERSAIAPGETPPPFDLDVADLLSEIMSVADELADRTCWAVLRPVPPPAPSAFADPGPCCAVVPSPIDVLHKLHKGTPRVVVAPLLWPAVPTRSGSVVQWLCRRCAVCRA